jgi:hypothetical protein
MSKQLKSLSLSELRDALDKRKISTSTGSLKGEQRKQELLFRLEKAFEAEKLQRSSFIFEEVQEKNKIQSEQFAALSDKNEEENEEEEKADSVSSLRKDYTLQEIRHELEKKRLPTTTPGLKGEARRYALIQRLMNYHESSRSQVKLQKSQ